MSLVGRLETGVFDSGAAEIPAYHAPSRTLLVTGGDTIWRIDLSDLEAPGLLGAIAAPEGMTSTSVAVHGDIFAVAFAGPSGAAGTVAFLDSAGNTLATVPVGHHPDMLTFTSDGRRVLDVTVPRLPRYLGYAHNRPTADSPAAAESCDLGPEGLLFVEVADSPNGVPLLIVANEVSGTISIYAVHL